MSTLILCERICVENSIVNGGIVVNSNGKIDQLLIGQDNVRNYLNRNKPSVTFDFAKYVLMPGLIDSHVHINEPGRAQWEGFATATKAAARGGFTTIVDMPLNSIPPTTTLNNLIIKQQAAQNKLYVDVAFWGGLIPGNQDELLPLWDNGVVGFKGFLCPSGVDEFLNITEKDVEIAYETLKDTNALLAFHAEKCNAKDYEADTSSEDDEIDKEQALKYKTYLKTRPPSLEINAIKLVTKFAKEYKTVRTHIVHLSAAEAIPIIKQFRAENGDRLTVETCHHYLTLAAEDVPDGHVEYKCCPPIRDRRNQNYLWQAIQSGVIDLVVSDHSPSTPDMKLITDSVNRGNFLKAWGGISSVQFGLSLFWTHCQKYGLDIKDMIKLMSTGPAKLCQLDDRKGRIVEGYDADFCVWDPEAEVTIAPNIIEFRNKANPYMGQTIKGRVHATFVRGCLAFYENDNTMLSPVGQLTPRKNLEQVE